MFSKGHTINLRKLLSMHLRDNEVITRSIRIRLQNLSFQISFYLNGESLCLTKIRPILKQTPVSGRIQKRMRTLESSYKQCGAVTCEPKETAECPEVEDKLTNELPCSKDAETQTPVKRFRSISCTTQRAVQFSKSQQTHRTFFRNSICQTVCCSSSYGVQTEIANDSHTTQTDLVRYSFGTQTEIFQYDRKTQTDDLQIERSERLESERTSLVLILNEIGSILLKQDDVLSNNSTLLEQISRLVVDKKAQLARKLQKHKDVREYNNYRDKMRHVVTRKKCFAVKKFSKFVQTDHNLYMASICTLTAPMDGRKLITDV